MKPIKRLFRKANEFILDTLACFAPYCVINSEMRKEHFCWTWKQSLEWLKCYEADGFGETVVYGLTGSVIAAKG